MTSPRASVCVAGDKDRRRADGPVEHAVAVGMSQRLGHLTDYPEAVMGVDLGWGVEEPAVEGPGLWIVLKRAGTGRARARSTRGGPGSGVAERVEVLELPPSGTTGCFSLIGRGVLLQRVET